uniref:PBECR3 domain-containing polyvalent protein n=1 Tax=Helicobacter suis TaxID=104628 RepID=UPI000CF03A71
IATSVGGAAQFQVTKAAFGFIVRTLPYIPFAKALNDKVSGAALRYHIKAALNKSHSIEAFKQNLNKIANRAEFSNATKALIREIEQNLPKSVESGGTQTNIEGRALQNEVPVKVQDQAQVVKAQEIQDTELAPKSVGNTPAAEQTLPTKTKLERDLAPQEIHEVISKWDLSATSNKSGKQRLVVARVEAKEAEELTKALEFTGERDLVREIDSHQVIHALKQHGDIAKEAQRGQIAINLEDISHYIDTIKEADFKHIQDNRRVLYAKQVNGHVVVIEEALSGQDKLRFFDMWKQRGKLNKEVLLSHSQRPNTTSSLNLEGHMPSNITTPPTPSSKGYDLDRTLSRGYQPEATKSPLKSQETNTNNYIDVEVIDHPKALPYKTTGQIYKEAKAKGLSYVEFKALRDQEKATRALHTTRYIEFKKAESQNIKDLLDSSKPLRMLKPTEITERLLDQVKKHNAKVWVGELKDLTLANQLKLDTNHPIKITFNGSSLTHVEKQHGQHSIHYLKNKQPPVGIQDIREYPKVINEADVSKIIENKDGQKLLASAKQINGYFMVVETISTKHNELKLKTLYKENGEWSKNKIFSDNGNMGLRLSKDSEDSLSPKPSVHLDARPQVTTPDSSSLPLKNQDELTPEVQELLTKIRQDWNKKDFKDNTIDFEKALHKHLDLENGNYSPNLSPDVKKALKHSYDQDSLSIAKGIEIDYPIKATQTLPYFKTALENPDYLLQNLRGELKFIKKIDEDHYAVVQWNRYLNSFDPKKDTPYWRLELWDQESLKSELKYTNSTDPIDLARGFTSKQIHNGQLGFSKEEVNKWRLEELERSNAHKAALQKDIEEMVKEETSKKNTKPKKAKDYNQPEKISLDNLYKVSTNLPVNASFGKNYTSYRWNGKKEKAIEGLLHLMYEKTRRSGQIAPAFYRQDLGGIDIYTQFELKGIGGSGIKDQPSKGLELLKDQPQDFLTPVGQANKDFQKWRNTHLAAYITKTILEGDVIEVGHNKVILSMRDTYNGKIWDIEAGIHFTNNADPSQPKRYMLEEFKVREVKEKPALSRSEGKTSTTKSENQEIPHNKAFGTNFKEFYHDPKGAIAKLIEVKEGQVAGAFYREDLGDIDLVWGEIRDQGGKLKGHGLAKIVEKHLDDFKGFEGNSALEKLGRGLEEIVENGKVVMQENQRATIVWHEGKHLYKVGLKNNWMGKPTKNRWIVTAYQDNKVKEKP